MTTTTIGAAPAGHGGNPPTVPGVDRRPALRFTVVVVLVLALLAGLRWTGAVAPRATLASAVPSAADLTYDPATGWGWVAFEVRNDGALPIRVDAIDLTPQASVDDVRILQRDEDEPADGRTYPGVPAGVADVTSLAPFDGFELSGHGRREIVLLIHVTCQQAWPGDFIESVFDPRAGLQVTTRSVTGLTDRIGFDGFPRDDRPDLGRC